MNREGIPTYLILFDCSRADVNNVSQWNDGGDDGLLPHRSVDELCNEMLFNYMGVYLLALWQKSSLLLFFGIIL